MAEMCDCAVPEIATDHTQLPSGKVVDNGAWCLTCEKPIRPAEQKKIENADLFHSQLRGHKKPSTRIRD